MNKINRFIAGREKEREKETDLTAGERGAHASSTLTLGEMETVEATKAVLLGLVHLKRLDIGSVDGSKVYKVKKS